MSKYDFDMDVSLFFTIEADSPQQAYYKMRSMSWDEIMKLAVVVDDKVTSVYQPRTRIQLLDSIDLNDFGD